MSGYMDNLTILYSIIGRNTIILTSFAIFCHNLCSLSFCGGP